MELNGKVVMITGASGCIGRATALRMAQEGAKLILCDVSEKGVESIMPQLEKLNCETMVKLFDVRDYSKAVECVNEGIEHFGCIDALVNIAGGSAGLLNKLSTFAESEPSTWDFVMGINVQGSFNCTRAVVNHMIERKSGRIILFGSIAGVGGLAGRADYSAAKGALSSFTKALAMELGQYYITVNCVSPGAIHRGDVPISHMTYIGPEGMSTGPEPVADMCVYLVSEKAWFITGQNYQVDGGRTLGSVK